MNKLFLYNTLTRKKEEFKAIKKDRAGLYTCGPTVYNYAHLGNLRSYLFEDILKRVLFYNGYKVKHVMNITDVGHLTGDRDMGEDKLEIGAKREGKTAWEIAEFYTQAFKNDIKTLNILPPDIWCKATGHTKEQINLIKILEKKGYTYKTSDGIYFNTAKFKNYAKLSRLNLKTLKEGARVEKNDEKKNATDFALWKFSIPLAPLVRGVKAAKRQMEWQSPWGVGFPGWHIECSAMSLKYLGDHFDIHCGGVDHIGVHHTNEIAQTEAATGKSPWVNYWLHGAFLNIAGGKKMAKSEDNFLTMENALIKKGINPLAFRFAALQTHYRKPMEYSEESIKSAKNGWVHLYNQVQNLGIYDQASGKWIYEMGNVDLLHKEKFFNAINDDLNIPQALAVAQELLKSNLSQADKLSTIIDFDKVFGLDLDPISKMKEFVALPDDVRKLIVARQTAR
ncbi:cysteine--tRNA ligase, partial [Candidatus Falkowbacteria bacterium]|nr:cysteine--tRNA ligase [Candidatus Falkowbacteria bacterium]